MLDQEGLPTQFGKLFRSKLLCTIYVCTLRSNKQQQQQQYPCPCTSERHLGSEVY